MKKKCIEEQLLWEYIDDELAVDERDKVEQHLDECPCCKQQYRELRSFESHLVVGFEYDFFDCSDIPINNNSTGKFIKSSIHTQKYSVLWRRLIFTGIVALVTAIVVIALMSPYLGGVPLEVEFCWLRFLIFSLLALALKPISMLIIGLVGAIGAGWSLMLVRN